MLAGVFNTPGKGYRPSQYREQYNLFESFQQNNHYYSLIKIKVHFIFYPESHETEHNPSQS